ncbi:cupin domain-containing protein [Microbacterium sp. NPDC096154]|uniref:cupin domain-containing protein n=1 Tax=Microbacterium sp. NPDC096154 TaxID=3155549 RepID=UPI0033304950
MQDAEAARAETADDHELDLGRRLRALRRAKGLSLRTVAEGAAVSESFLSQVERGVASPSVASLRRICAALDEPMGALFQQGDEQGREDSPLVRVADRRRIFRPDGSADYMLTPAAAQHLQIHYNVVAPGRSSGRETYSHAGEEECVIVLEGELSVTWRDRTYRLEKGDALLITPTEGHRFENHGTTPATVLWVITPANSDM